MVTLASYESSQHCESIVSCLLWEYAFHLGRRVSVVMNLGFCRPQASVRGLLMINIQVQCPMLLWVWLQFELVCDNPRNTVLDDASTTFSLLFTRKSLTKEEMGKLANTVEMASLDAELMK